MSVRHLSRLRGGPRLLHAESEDDSHEEKAGMGRSSRFRQALDSDSDDADEGGNEHETSRAPEGAAARQEERQCSSMRRGATTRDRRRASGSGKDDDKDLDELLCTVRNEAGGLNVHQHEAKRPGAEELASWFRLDRRALNVEIEMLHKFGTIGDEEDGEGDAARRRGPRRRGRSGSSALAQLYIKKCWLGPPKDSWQRPPTFVSGGIRLVRCDPPVDVDSQEASFDWFCFEWSPAYQELHRKFEVLQDDPNSLAVFLAHNPHHVDGLLNFALVFAHTGQAARAADYVRRCLFVLESAYCESFRPADGGRCRMDVRRPENRAYFAALSTHVRMVGARGLYRTAFEVSRLLLSLDPTRDPMCVLLCLDFYAIRCGAYRKLSALRDSELAVKHPLQPPGQRDNSHGEQHGEQQTSQEAAEDGAQVADVSVAALLNLAYSCALAHLYEGRKQEAQDTLRSALLRFPVVVRPLVERLKNDLGSRLELDWDLVLNHALFRLASSRLPAGHVLHRLAAVYVARAGTLWQDHEALCLLNEGAREVITEVDQGGWGYTEEVAETSGAFAEGSPMERYLSAEVSDDFVTLPQDLIVLDPVLMDPAVARRARLRFLGPGRGEQPRMQEGPIPGFGEPSQPNRLSPGLPLAELFWRTLLPWNTVG